LKYVICYSGGHSSSLCAIECVRRYGKENIILLNHNITQVVESADVKRFKEDVANYLGLEITYANHKDWEEATPVQVCRDEKAWKVGNGSILCTNRLKTAPFKRWMKANDPKKENIYVYGFDKSEPSRVTRRSQIMGIDGYKTAYPMLWPDNERTIQCVSEIDVSRPNEYEKFKHANCIGCLKAGWQHWYIVYLERQDIWESAKEAEEYIGYAIHKDNHGPVYLEDKEEQFETMKRIGIIGTELVIPQRFWADAKRKVKEYNKALSEEAMPTCQIDMMAEMDKGVCLDCIA
tara:strand:- start:2756 stop:3628 length:873 start_codon:yes stop_codon:yes gene_type:complete